MELIVSPFSFEILQIESVSLFFVVLSMASATWLAYREHKGLASQNRGTAAVLIVGAFFGLLVCFCYLGGPSQFIMSAELAFGIILSMLRPANALAFFICLVFLRPWEVAGDNPLLLSLPRITGLLTIVGTVAAFYRSDLKRLRFGRGQWFLVAFAAWTLLTTFVGPNPGDQQQEYFDIFFRALIVFFLIVAVVRTERDLALFRHIYLWSIAGLAVVSIYLSWDQLWSSASDSTDRLHAIGSLENANDLAAVMVIGIPFALRRFSEGSRRPLIWIESSFFLVITLMALYLAQSRGALLALGAGGIGWWILRSKRRWLAVGLGVLIIAAATPFANEVLRRDSEDLQESKASRLNYWNAGLKMVLHNPLFGVGFARYPKEYQSYSGDGEQFEFGERTAHSTWILALAETGIPGLIFLLGFVFSVIGMAKRIIPYEPDLFVSLVAYLIAISFLSHTYVLYPYLLMGLVVAAYRMHYRSEKGWAA